MTRANVRIFREVCAAIIGNMTERLHLFATLLILVLSPAIATAQNDESEPDALHAEHPGGDGRADAHIRERLPGGESQNQMMSPLANPTGFAPRRSKP